MAVQTAMDPSQVWNTIPLSTLCGWPNVQVDNGAILVPAGVYRITKTLDTRKNIVLSGAGKSLTTLYFPLSLTQVYGNTWSEVSRALPQCLTQAGSIWFALSLFRHTTHLSRMMLQLCHHQARTSS